MVVRFVVGVSIVRAVGQRTLAQRCDVSFGSSSLSSVRQRPLLAPSQVYLRKLREMSSAGRLIPMFRLSRMRDLKVGFGSCLALLH